MMTTLHVARAASLWYPIMLAQEREEISESKGAELLGMSLLDYRAQKQIATQAVIQLVTDLPSPLTSLVDILKETPEWFESTACASNSNGTETQDEST